MAKENQDKYDFLDSFVFAHISYKFEEEKESDEIGNLLSKISLNRFEIIKGEYNIERASFIEEYFPDLSKKPHLSFLFKNFEVFLSSKKINISFPITASEFGQTLKLRGRRGFFPLQIPEEERHKLDIKSLEEIEAFVKVFLINNLLNKKIPKLENCIVDFQIELNDNPSFKKVNQLVERQLFKNHEFSFENFNFEITEGENKYYFGLTPKSDNIVCSFVYEADKVSILEDELIDILEKSYNKYNEIIRILEI